jgi:hypothetical protein
MSIGYYGLSDIYGNIAETAGGILPKRVWRQTLLDTRLCDEWLDKTVGDTYHEPPWL